MYLKEHIILEKTDSLDRSKSFMEKLVEYIPQNTRFKKKNLVKAIKYFKKAAGQGNLEAQEFFQKLAIVNKNNL